MKLKMTPDFAERIIAGDETPDEEYRQLDDIAKRMAATPLRDDIPRLAPEDTLVICERYCWLLKAFADMKRRYMEAERKLLKLKRGKE